MKRLLLVWFLLAGFAAQGQVYDVFERDEGALRKQLVFAGCTFADDLNMAGAHPLTTQLINCGISTQSLLLRYAMHGDDLDTEAKEPLTNYILESASFDSATWAKNFVTVSANVIVSPIDGSLTGDKIVETADTNIHRLQQLPNAFNGLEFTLAIWAKKAEREHLVISLNDGSWRNVYYNLDTGAVGTVEGSFSASILDVGDGWYLCVVSGTSNSTSFFVGIADSDGSANYAGDITKGLYFGAVGLRTYATHTAAEMAAIYQSTTDLQTVPDKSGSGNDGTLGPTSGAEAGDPDQRVVSRESLMPAGSEDLDNWVLQNGVTAASATVLRETADTSSHNFTSDSVAMVVGRVYTYSATVTADGRTLVNLGVFGNAWHECKWVDLTDGSVVGTQTVVPTVVDLGSGRYRITHTFIAMGNNLAPMVAVSSGTTSTSFPSYAGDVTKGVIVEDAVLNLGPTPIPPTGASTYRVAGARFDGTDDRIVSQANVGITGDAAFTVAMLVKADDSTVESPLFEGGDGTVAAAAYGLWQSASFLGGSEGKYSLAFASHNFNSDIGIPIGGWHVVTVTKAPGAIDATTSVYINGIAGGDNGSSSSSTPNITDAVLTLGAWAGGGPFYWDGGDIAQALVYSRAFTANNTASLYDAMRVEAWEERQIPLPARDKLVGPFEDTAMTVAEFEAAYASIAEFEEGIYLDD